MADQNYAELTIDARIDGADRTGVFQFGLGERGTASVTEQIRTGYLVGGRGSAINAVLQETLDDGVPKRKGIYLGLGGGAHVFDLSFQTPGDRRDESGSLFQWGSSANAADGPNAHTATGSNDPIIQQNVFMQYLRLSDPDSITPATFSYGEFTAAGDLDGPLDVAIESPQIDVANDEPTAADGSMTIVEVESIDDVLDATAQEEG